MSDEIPKTYELELTITTPNGVKKAVARQITPSELNGTALPLAFLLHQVQGMAYRLTDALREDPPS